MKIAISCEDLKIQASYLPLKHGPGCELTIYFFSGGRYQYDAHWATKGDDYLDVALWEGDIWRGDVTFTPETEEEKCFGPNFGIWSSRNKEEVSFLLIPYETTSVDMDRTKLQYKRTF